MSFKIKRKTPGPSSPVQEKQKGKKMTNWNEGEKGPLDYSSKSDNNTNGGDKVEDLSMNQYVNVIYFYFNQDWKIRFKSKLFLLI
jgi:hypothetical protein